MVHSEKTICHIITRQGIKYLCLKKEEMYYFTSFPKMGLIGLIRKAAQLYCCLICERHTDTELLLQGVECEEQVVINKL